MHKWLERTYGTFKDILGSMITGGVLIILEEECNY
jgi:hypothetical protein